MYFARVNTCLFANVLTQPSVLFRVAALHQFIVRRLPHGIYGSDDEIDPVSRGFTIMSREDLRALIDVGYAEVCVNHRAPPTPDCQIGKWLYYNFATGSFHIKKLCSRFYSIEVEFYFLKTKKSLFEPPFGDLGAMYALHLQLVGKPVFDFLFFIIELFLLSLTAETL